MTEIGGIIKGENMLDIRKTCSACGNRIALLSDSGEAKTYEELVTFADGFAAAVPSHSLVFILAENSFGAVMGYVACLLHECVPLLLNSATEASQLRHLCEVYTPSYIWLPDVNSSIGDSYTAIFKASGYTLLQTGYKPFDLHSDLALLLSTSGSTGSPKLVRLSRQNVHSNAESIAQYLQITAEERPITSLPLYYSFGLSVINSHLLRGATILLTKYSVSDSEFWQFAREQHATSLSGVPYTWQMLKQLRFMRMQTPDLRTLTQAGGKLSPELAKEYIDWAAANGKRFYVMYGQTEATARMSYLPWDVAAEKPGSIGVAIPNGRFELRDMDGIAISEPDKQGELVYYGPNVSMGYAQKSEDLLLGDCNNGCLHTGDIAMLDSDGDYYIVGRMKRFLKIFGLRIGLDEVERLILSHFDTDCYCCGTDEKLHVKVTNPDVAGQIPLFLEQQIHLFRQYIQISVVEKILRNEVGKVIAQ